MLPPPDTSVGRAWSERGAGLIGVIAGFMVVFAFLLFSVQLLMNLHTTSMVSSSAYEAARTAAAGSVDTSDPAAVDLARSRGEQRARQLLGGLGERVSFDWSASTADTVVLGVHAESPRFLLPGVQAALGFDTVERTIRVRVERPR